MNKIVITADVYVGSSYRQLGEDIIAACNAGASAVHLHVANYADIKALKNLIYSSCPEILIIPELINIDSDMKGELAVIADEPEIAVLKCDLSLMGRDNISAEENMRKLGSAMLENGVRPLLECCDKSMTDTAMNFYKEGLLTDPLLFLFRPGRNGVMNQSMENLLHLKNSVPQTSSWSIAAQGDNYMEAAAEAVLMGGNVSIGGASHDISGLAERVGKVEALIRQLGRDTANPAETRRLMSLNTKYRRVIDEHLL